MSVNLAQRLPLRGAGYIAVGFGANPTNVDAMTARVLEEVEQLRRNGPTLDLTTRAKETARRSHEIAMRQNGYWTRNLQAAHFLGYDPGEVLERPKRIAAMTPAALRDTFGRYFPVDHFHGRDARTRIRASIFEVDARRTAGG